LGIFFGVVPQARSSYARYKIRGIKEGTTAGPASCGGRCRWVAFAIRSWRGKETSDVAIEGIDRVGGAGAIGPARSGGRITRPEAAGVTGGDRVELSAEAKLLTKIHELPDVRGDKIESVRREIVRGTYETPDKIDAVVDRLLAEFRGQAI
jgi:hypothetical protein